MAIEPNTARRGSVQRRAVFRWVVATAAIIGGLAELTSCTPALGRQTSEPTAGVSPPPTTAPALPPPQAVPRGTAGALSVGVVAEPVVLDTAQTLTHSDDKLALNIFDSLVEQEHGTFRLVPGLARSWSTTNEGRTFVLLLRSGVTFHDGTPFNAAAAKFSIDRQIDEQHPAYTFGNWPTARARLGSISSVQAIQSDFARVGVRATLRHYDWGAYQSVRAAGDFQMAAFSWTPAIGNPDVILYAKFHSSQISPVGYNNTFYADPDLDRLLEDARTTADDNERRDDYRQAQVRITAAATHIFVDHDPNVVAATSRLQGFRPQPSSQFLVGPDVTLA